MWCLIRNLPLMIGDLIPENNKHWELILSLLQIISIIFAPAIYYTRGDILYASVYNQVPPGTVF